METRHYIGLTGDGLHLTVTYGPAEPEKFADLPAGPIPIAGVLLYPVSAEVAAEWTNDEDDEVDW